MTTLYGLPEHVEFCARCCISNQRPNSAREYEHTKDSKKETIHFDEDGVCDACRFAEKKKQIDWVERERQLVELCDKHRSKTGEWDCIVPGSGGKDSFYAAHVLRHKYGMHPLLCTWAPAMYTDVGRRNLERWQSIADHILVTPRRETHRLLTRLALENLFHVFAPFIIGQKGLAPKLAAKFEIPLIFYGESESEYGNPIASAFAPLRDVSWWMSGKDIHLSGVRVDDLKTKYGLTNADLSMYLPTISNFTQQIQVHYLGYYLKWHPQSCYYYASEHGNFEAAPERTPGTYSKYNSIDDKIDDLHYWTTHVKFGIGRATYDAAQEIRSGDITREEGIALVHRFDGEYPARFEKEVFEYLSVPGFPPMTREYLMELANKFRSPHLWELKGPYGKWELKHRVS